MGELDGRAALVTGTARYRGLGRAIALQLAKEGADLIVSGRKTSILPGEKEIGWTGNESLVEEIENLGRRAIAVECDVTDKDQVIAMIDRTKEAFGRLDIIVNNAGVASEAGSTPIFETPEDLWRSTMDINVTGTFLVSKYGGRYMLECGNGGSIIMISSTAGRVGLPNYGAYCASKFAVVGLTQQMALELAQQNIRVNCIAPGSHTTDMMDGTIGRTAKVFNTDTENVTSGIRSAIPMGRQGNPVELANATVFLCTDKASYMTGQTLNVDGGVRME